MSIFLIHEEKKHNKPFRKWNSNAIFLYIYNKKLNFHLYEIFRKSCLHTGSNKKSNIINEQDLRI